MSYLVDSRRIYIESEPNWQFTLSDILLVVSSTCVACSVCFAIRRSNDIDGPGLATLAGTWMFSNIVALMTAVRWVRHSRVWLQKHGVVLSRRRVVVIWLRSLFWAWTTCAYAMGTVVCGCFVVLCGIVGVTIRSGVSDAFAPYVLGGMLLFWLGLIVPAYMFFRRAWRETRPRVWFEKYPPVVISLPK